MALPKEACEVAEWMAMHEGVSKRACEDSYKVVIESKCDHLLELNGQAVCGIYGERPRICIEHPRAHDPDCPGLL